MILFFWLLAAPNVIQCEPGTLLTIGENPTCLNAVCVSQCDPHETTTTSSTTSTTTVISTTSSTTSKALQECRAALETCNQAQESQAQQLDALRAELGKCAESNAKLQSSIRAIEADKERWKALAHHQNGQLWQEHYCACNAGWCPLWLEAKGTVCPYPLPEVCK